MCRCTPGATALALLLSWASPSCAVRTAQVEGARTPRGAALCPDLSGPASAVLGEADLLFVQPGDVVRGKVQLVTPPSPGLPAWQVRHKEELAVHDSTLQVWSLLAPGHGAALVLLRSRPGPPTVIGTYAVASSSALRQLQVVARWQRQDCAMAVLLLREEDRPSRTGSGAASEGGANRPVWLAVGVSPERAWRASDLLYGPVELTAPDGWPWLRTLHGRPVRLVLNAETLRFVEAR